MATRRDWVWGRLTSAHLALAEACCSRWLQVVRDRKLPQIRYSHTKGELYQKRLGAEGEIAFRVITGRPLPSVEQMVATWRGADVDEFSVKTIGGPGYRLLFDDGDIKENVEAFALVLNAKPRFAIVGWIEVAAALRVRKWATDIQRPTWAVRQDELRPWAE